MNLSPSMSALNCLATRHWKVGPRREPEAGVSASPPVYRSMSPTLLSHHDNNHNQAWHLYTRPIFFQVSLLTSLGVDLDRGKEQKESEFKLGRMINVT